MLDLLRRSVHLLLALLRAASQTEDEVKGGFLLNVVVGKSAAVFELLAGEDQALLVRRNAFLVFCCSVSTGKDNLIFEYCGWYLGFWP